MSYDVYLLKNKEGEPLKVPRFEEGGTYAVGGINEAHLNVTYNYSKLFSVSEELDGKTAEDTIPILEKAVFKFGTVRTKDYWEPSPGNVGYACNILLGWARLYPDAIWEVS